MNNRITQARSRLRAQLKAVSEGSKSLISPGIYDCLSALIAEQAGAECVLISGAGMGASAYGLPDLGILNLTDTIPLTRAIAGAVSIPVIADAETGFGGPNSVARTTQLLEESGVAGFFMEDQGVPWRCGQFDEKVVIPRDEMVGKIRAATDARQDDTLTIVARTDALASEGMEATLKRCDAYLDAGADALFLSAPRTEDHLRSAGDYARDRKVPVLVNMVEGSKTPYLSVDSLAELGLRFVTFAATMQCSAIMSMRNAVSELVEKGTAAALYPSRMDDWLMPSRLVKLDDYVGREHEFGVLLNSDASDSKLA